MRFGLPLDPAQWLALALAPLALAAGPRVFALAARSGAARPVSNTHLTLPTKRIV